MRICVAIAEDSSRDSAGVNIRYGRLQLMGPAVDAVIDIVAIDNLCPGAYGAFDLLIISKCYSVKAMVAARRARLEGCLVAVDVFDDYFSTGLLQLQWLENWFRQMLEESDFAITSTSRLIDVVKSFDENKFTLLLPDSNAGVSATELRTRFEIKADLVNKEVLWFGLAGNPYFPVGCHDLIHYGQCLQALAEEGYQLKIVTNLSYISAETMVKLNSLPIVWQLIEWSPETESEYLERASVAFLPVNTQNFSIAKSANRAATALQSGVQVISPGFQLYREFSKFVYSDSQTFISDKTTGSLRLRFETLEPFYSQMEDYSSIRVIERLLAFVKQLEPRVGSDVFGVIHSFGGTGDVHKFVQRHLGLSVATPFSRLRLNPDVLFAPGSRGALRVYLRDKVAKKYYSMAMVSGKSIRINESSYYLVPEDNLMVAGARPILPSGDATEELEMYAVYPDVMEYVRKVLDQIFPGIVMYCSESLETPVVIS